MKKKSLILLTVVFTLLVTGAMAATSAGNRSATNTDLFNVYDFKFQIIKGGINRGLCPVYTAPYASAFRAANGKASVDTTSRVDVAGYDKGWLLVRYETKTGYRVGYIPPQYANSYHTNMELHFSYIPQTAVDTIALTDNPLDNYSAIAYLEPGETYYILGKYTYHGNWWYIECEVDGQPARGFIDRNTTVLDVGGGVYSSELGDPPASPKGGSKIGQVVVTTDNSMVRADAGVSNAMVARAHISDVYPAYGRKTASNGKTWYYVYVDGVWGYISEGVCRFEQ